tara:strand:+ start:318 stop:584 length:267 start_codon:yes stop_codon:yes gene_type:complete
VRLSEPKQWARDWLKVLAHCAHKASSKLSRQLLAKTKGGDKLQELHLLDWLVRRSNDFLLALGWVKHYQGMALKARQQEVRQASKVWA